MSSLHSISSASPTFFKLRGDSIILAANLQAQRESDSKPDHYMQQWFAA
jgi:hypothetical protein